MFRIALAVCVCVGAAASASAQDDRSVGLTVGYPSAVGVIWQAADRVAIRADTLFSSSWTDTDSSNAGDEFLRLVGVSSSTSSRTVGVGVSVLITVARWERLRAYVAPRAAYLRSTSTSEFSFPTGTPALPPLPGLPVFPIRIQPVTFETRTSTQTYSGSFGTQYRPADRFAAFGEVGVAYASSRSPETGSLVFSSEGPPSPIFTPPGGVTSSFITPPSLRPRTNTLGIRSGVGIIFFF